MTDTQKKPLWKNELIWLFLITSGLFAVLYSKFILGGYAYVFTDTGADTMQINYAQYGLFSSLFRSGESGYVLQAGLGMDVSSYYPAYLIPYNLLILLAPQRLLPWAVLASAYLKMITISLVGYLFYRKLMKDGIGTMAAALAWTFSGYVILWGQHYGFCTCMALFTVFMYFLQCYLNGEQRWKNAGLVLTVTMLLVSSYYFLYMIAFFAVFYVFIYSIMQRYSLKRIVVKEAGLGGMGILGVLIGGVALVPIADTFLESARAGVLAAKGTSHLLSPYKGKTLGTILARFFSNHMLGIDKDYTGCLNYYEGMILAVSILTVFAVSYFIVKKSTRVKTLVLTAFLVFLTIMPLTSRILVFTKHSYRWTFMICFVEALAIGCFLQDVYREKDRKTVLAGSILAIAVCGGLLAWMYSFKNIKPDHKVTACVIGFFAIYLLLFAVGTSVKKLHRIFPAAVLMVLICELFVLDYPSLWQRESPTRNQVATEYYNDGTKEAVAMLKEQDDSVYRIEKSYMSASENDGMSQGYNGLSVYMSTNPASLVAYHKMYGPETLSGNFVDFNMDDYIRSSLLGAKYLITEAGYHAPQKIYTSVGEAGGKAVFENQYALPFGYLYDKEWKQEEVKEMSGLEKTLASLSGFYYTDTEKTEETSSYQAAVLPKQTDMSLLDHADTAIDCTMEQGAEGIKVSDLGADPNVVFSGVESCFADEDRLYGLSMTVDAPDGTEMAVYYQTEGDEGFSAEKVYTFTVTADNRTWEHLVPGGITALRVDVSSPVESAVINRFELKSCDINESGYTALKESGINETTFSDSTYRAQVTNDASENKMLCVPLFYQKGWTAQIDGEDTGVYEINEGMCGIEVPSGVHQITLKYETPYQNYGLGMTIIGIIIFILAFSQNLYKFFVKLC